MAKFKLGGSKYMRERQGIQRNALVLPSSINISSDRVVAYQENGFSLDIPEAKRKKLTDTFFRACGVSKKERKRIYDILYTNKVKKLGF